MFLGQRGMFDKHSCNDLNFVCRCRNRLPMLNIEEIWQGQADLPFGYGADTVESLADRLISLHS